MINVTTTVKPARVIKSLIKFLKNFIVTSF